MDLAIGKQNGFWVQAEVALSHTDMDPRRETISTTVFLQGACMGYAILWEGKWLVTGCTCAGFRSSFCADADAWEPYVGSPS